MDDEYSGDSFGGFCQKNSSPGSPISASVDNVASLESAQRSNNITFHHNKTSNAASRDAAKKKRVSRIMGGGLRQFSVIVCNKLKSKGRTTYGEVADEIISEYAGIHSETAASLSEFDEKNIRRRVYDALNVLMALDIITRDKKEIQWKGLPTSNMKDFEDIKAQRVNLMNRIAKKVADLKDLEEQIAGLQNLVLRNKQLLKSGNTHHEGFSLPFILVQTSPDAMVEIEISEDMRLVHFDFNSTPFSLYDDAYILKLLRCYQQPETRSVSQRSSVYSSPQSGIASGGNAPFSWNSVTQTSKCAYIEMYK